MISKKNIYVTLIININQTGIILIFRENNITYEIKRAKQVFNYRKNKKHIFTTILLSFCKN